ncbi:unnamed protein product, partial [Ilex paraguariensis]
HPVGNTLSPKVGAPPEAPSPKVDALQEHLLATSSLIGTPWPSLLAPSSFGRRPWSL